MHPFSWRRFQVDISKDLGALEVADCVFIFFVQRSAKKHVRGCENFVPALAYLICLALPGSCLARFTNLFADLCITFDNRDNQNLAPEIKRHLRDKTSENEGKIKGQD